jgi:uncharacterized protein YbbC (DUF1343 family)
MLLRILILSLFIFLNNQILDCNSTQAGSAAPVPFRLGNELLLSESISEIKGQRVALLTNQTGILPDGTHIIDAMINSGINVVKIFSPEHGIRGDENYSDKDDKTGIPIVSLYNGKVKPSASDLSDVDVLVYDIQDVGARFYTYTSTLYYAIEAASESGTKFIVCDRPVIINPDYVDGFILDESHSSFVGKIPAPVCYGMTCGELAGYLNASVYSNRCSLIVIKMSGYNRTMDFNSLKIKWVKPSPNMFTSTTAVCYPSTCFMEGTNVSEGRGTDKPFEYCGAPWVDANQFAEELNSFNLPGVKFEAAAFTPSEKVSNYPPKFFGKECDGVFINVTDKKKFEAVKCGVALLVTLHKLFPDFKLNKDNYIDKLAGTDKLRKMLSSGRSFESIIQSWENDVNAFRTERLKQLLYN